MSNEVQTEPTGFVNPNARHEWLVWHGRLLSIKDCPAHDFKPDEVAEVVAEYETSDDYEGDSVGVWRLTDGRFVAYETFFGPTGDGFSEDAYGGDADISFASTLDDAVAFGLTDKGRSLLGFPNPTPTAGGASCR